MPNVVLIVLYHISVGVHQWLELVHIPDVSDAVGGLACNPIIFRNGEFWQIILVVPQDAWTAYSKSDARKLIGEEAQRNGIHRDSIQLFTEAVVL